jgi:hypothetical protein
VQAPAKAPISIVSALVRHKNSSAHMRTASTLVTSQIYIILSRLNLQVLPGRARWAIKCPFDAGKHPHHKMPPYFSLAENTSSLDTTAPRLSRAVRNQIVTSFGGGGETICLPSMRAETLSQWSLLIGTVPVV